MPLQGEKEISRDWYLNPHNEPGSLFNAFTYAAVSVSCCCCNKLPQTWWLQIEQIYYGAVLVAGSPKSHELKSQSWQGWLLWILWGETLFPVCSSLWGLPELWLPAPSSMPVQIRHRIRLSLPRSLPLSLLWFYSSCSSLSLTLTLLLPSHKVIPGWSAHPIDPAKFLLCHVRFWGLEQGHLSRARIQPGILSFYSCVSSMT